MEDLSGNKIAESVLSQYELLPKKSKPLFRGGGIKEWVPMSGIVAQGKHGLVCLAVATGMKCLPQSKVAQAQGTVLHDWHAEILALRSFNRFLLEECYALANSDQSTSDFVRRREADERTEESFQPFALVDGLNLHMYCSEAPCGDASMELTMAAQEDATPWDLPPAETSQTSSELPAHTLPGRSYFSNLGIVRRKPSRPDAPPTLSKSCSDKMALKQCTSILSSITSTLISPTNAYLKSVVIPESQYSERACTRSFGSEGRMRDMQSKYWKGGYEFRLFQIKTTKHEFEYSRRQPVADGEKIVPSNNTASWFRDAFSLTAGKLEVMTGGILQGRKTTDIRGASRVCRRRTWKIASEITTLLDNPKCQSAFKKASYRELKDSHILEERRRLKEDVRSTALSGWVRNTGDDDFDCTGVEL